MAMHEQFNIYEESEVQLWGIYKTSRSVNWKTTERFVQKHGGVMKEFCEDDVFLERCAETEK